jgi:hypothetical protein
MLYLPDSILRLIHEPPTVRPVADGPLRCCTGIEMDAVDVTRDNVLACVEKGTGSGGRRGSELPGEVA